MSYRIDDEHRTPCVDEQEEIETDIRQLFADIIGDIYENQTGLSTSEQRYVDAAGFNALMTIASINDLCKSIPEVHRKKLHEQIYNMIASTAYLSGLSWKYDRDHNGGGKRSSTGGVARSIVETVEREIDDEIERCGPHGPVNLARISANLAKHGIERRWRQLLRRLRDRGVDLPTTNKLSSGQTTATKA